MAVNNWIQETAAGVRIRVRVVPRAARNEVQGVLGNALKIRLQAPPVEGQANAALIEFLAERLDVSRRSVRLESGATGRNKTALITGRSAAEIAARLNPAP
jgi:hypothetical protein